MKRSLEVAIETFPIAGKFTISRGSRTEAVVVTATIREGYGTGRGECVPYRRYGESVEGVVETIETARDLIESGGDRAALLEKRCPPEQPATRSIAHCGISRRS